MALMLASAAPLTAHAALQTLNGTGAMTESFQTIGGSSQVQGAYDYQLAIPGTYSFGDTISQQTPTAIATYSATNNAFPNAPYGFQDSFRFALSSAANGDSLVVSLNLPPTYQINNLEYRLYMVGSMTDPTTAPLPSVGNPLPGGASIVNAWAGATALNPTDTATFYNLGAGTYVLDVAGTTAGLQGGTYTGIVQLQPVPLPAAVWLLGSALSAFGLFGRRRGD